MKARRTWLLFASITLIAAAGTYTFRDGDAAADAGTRRTVRVARDTIRHEVIATGVVRPTVGAEVKVGSRISGTVVRLPVEIGQVVEEGELLAELDATALQTSFDEARADVELARRRVDLASSTLERRRRLAEGGLVSSEDLEIVNSNLAIEQRRLEASEARLRASDIVRGYARISAPISGVISDISTRRGETVAAGLSAPTFVTIVDLDRLEVLAYVDETDIGRVTPGQSATFTVDTYPDQRFDATVTAIQPAAQLQGSVVNYLVRLKLNKHVGFALRPEMTAHVRILVEKREGALLVPRTAIQVRNARTYVVVDEAGKRVEKEVRIGWRSENDAEILDGIGEGDVIEVTRD